MFDANVVDEVELGYRAAGTEDGANGLHQGPQLRRTVCRFPNRLAVDTERDDIQERAAIHRADVDAGLDPVREGLERSDRIGRIQSQVPHEMVASAGGNADERESVCPRRCRDAGHGPVATRDPERVGAALERRVDRGGDASTRPDEGDLNTTLACQLGDPSPRGAAATGLRVHDGRSGRAEP